MADVKGPLIHFECLSIHFLAKTVARSAIAFQSKIQSKSTTPASASRDLRSLLHTSSPSAAVRPLHSLPSYSFGDSRTYWEEPWCSKNIRTLSQFYNELIGQLQS